jgi:hypothetical protein
MTFENPDDNPQMATIISDDNTRTNDNPQMTTVISDDNPSDDNPQMTTPR